MQVDLGLDAERITVLVILPLAKDPAKDKEVLLACVRAMVGGLERVWREALGRVEWSGEGEGIGEGLGEGTAEQRSDAFW